MAKTKLSSSALPKQRGKLLIEPKLFTESQWCEAANVDADNVLRDDQHSQAKPVRATKSQVLFLAADCRSKALRVMGGELGDSDEGDGVDINEWGLDLIGAAEVLEKLAGVHSPARPAVVMLDAEELATVLAALRLFQREYEDFSGDAIREAWPDHFEGIEPLGTDDIDTLCERINR